MGEKRGAARPGAWFVVLAALLSPPASAGSAAGGEDPCGVVAWNAFPGELSPEGLICMQANARGEASLVVDPDGGNTLALRVDSAGRVAWRRWLRPNNPTRCCRLPSGMALGAAGALAVSGAYEESPGNPWTGEFVRPYSGGLDVVVTKIEADGRPAWTTFLGSENLDVGTVGFIDAVGRTWVAGQSADSWGAPLRPFASGRDAFVALLAADGSLLWNTFLGGAGYESGASLLPDGAGGAWVTLQSDTGWGSPRRPHGGATDACVARLDAEGNLLWNTFLGGLDNDRLYTAARRGSALALAGESGSGWGGAQQLQPFTPEANRFVARLDGEGFLLWNSFFSFPAELRRAAFGADASLYLVGQSGASWGRPVRRFSGASDACVARFSPAGRLRWNTFLGGPDPLDDEGFPLNVDHALNIAPDTRGGVAVAGTSWLPWDRPLRTIRSGLDILWVARLRSDTGRLLWNAFLGLDGSMQETTFTGAPLAILGNGDILAAGHSWDSWGRPVAPKDPGSQISLARLRAAPPCSGTPLTGAGKR